MREPVLPTWDDIVDDTLTSLHQALAALSQAPDWLRSDWHPRRAGSRQPPATPTAR